MLLAVDARSKRTHFFPTSGFGLLALSDDFTTPRLLFAFEIGDGNCDRSPNTLDVRQGRFSRFCEPNHSRRSSRRHRRGKTVLRFLSMVPAVLCWRRRLLPCASV